MNCNGDAEDSRGNAPYILETFDITWISLFAYPYSRPLINLGPTIYVS